jgi:hypothetical protein
MIAGLFHQGSGLGNQLHRYVATRVLAMDKGFDFGMVHPQNFKGGSFMKIDLGSPVDPTIMKVFNEKRVNDVDRITDIRGYDPEINFVQDDTIIDGECQDPKYFEHHLGEIREWLEVEPLDMPDDVCVIGFRGGEYAIYPELFLTKDYWEEALSIMLADNPQMKFEVHTDDPALASVCFPEFKIVQNIGLNWRSVRYAKNLIIANSSFYIFPSLLNQNVNRIIAPRYWARRNTKTWALPSNYYKQFQYI